MTPLGFILLGLAVIYCAFFSWAASRAYNRGFGDGYNLAFDRSQRTIKHLLEAVAALTGRLAPVPASQEVAAEAERRGES